MKALTITPAHAFLGNSAPYILEPIDYEGGTLQVVWIPQIDAHGLFSKTSYGTMMLGTHHNGFSCHALAKRILAGDHARAVEQLEFLRNCGGTATDAKYLPTAPIEP